MAPHDTFLRLDDFEQLIRHRHSCRAFLNQPVAKERISRLLSAAQQTASWCNAQPWQVHIVSGTRLEILREALIAKAATGAQPTPDLDWPETYKGDYQSRRRECGWSLYRAVGIRQGDRVAAKAQANENFRLFGAPHLAVVSSPELLGTHGVMDCGAWVSNFMLAAAAMGIASIAQAAVASWPDVLRRHLGIASDRRIVCGISFGIEDSDHPANRFRTSRAPLAEVAVWID